MVSVNDDEQNCVKRIHNVSFKIHNKTYIHNIYAHLSNLYRTLVESHMYYANVIWGNLSNSNQESLQRLQERAISVIETSRIEDEWSNNFFVLSNLLSVEILHGHFK